MSINKNSRIKKSQGLIELQISIGTYNVILNVPKQTKVGDVVNIVKSYEKYHEQYGPMGCSFVGLASQQSNQIMDYWLMHSNFNFIRFKNKLSLKAIYSSSQKTNKISVNDFQFVKLLGEGAWGCVFMVRSRITGQIFAMKRSDKRKFTCEDNFKSIFRQKKILKQLPKSNHTVKFHASFESYQHFNFLFDFYPGSQLFVHLVSNKLSEQQSKIYFCEILAALQFLHKNGILYRDLKPQNILVDIFGHLCIADFGLSKCGFKEDDITGSNCGSPQYMAPEILQNKQYNFSADFYSIGAILFEFLTGYPPYYDKTKRSDDDFVNERLQKMKNMMLDLDSITKDRNLRALIKGLLHPDPQLRLSNFNQIKNCQWLLDIDWNKIENRTYEVPFIPSLYSTCIGQQFQDQDHLIQEMNQYQDDKFQPFEFFDYVKPESERIILGQSLTYKKQLHCMKKKTNGFIKQKSKAKKSLATNQTKGNISIALYEKQKHQHRQSRDDTATTSNSNVSNISGKEIKSRNYESKENMFKKDSSRKNILRKVPSTTKIQTNPSSHNVSQFSNRRIGSSKEKGLTLKTRNDINKSRIGFNTSSTPMNKSKSKEKLQKQLGLGSKKQSAYTSNKNKKQILPVSSYKIKLM